MGIIIGEERDIHCNISEARVITVVVVVAVRVIHGTRIG
jgi:hypothetical protein